MAGHPHVDACQQLAAEAAALRRSHPQAPAADILELVFKGRSLDAGGFADLAADPASSFGQLIAEAFDRGMTPQDWRSMTGPQADPRLVEALMEIWGTYVLPRFFARHCSSASESLFFHTLNRLQAFSTPWQLQGRPPPPMPHRRRQRSQRYEPRRR